MIEFIKPLLDPITIIIIISIIIVTLIKKDKNLVTLMWIGWTFIWIVLWLEWLDLEKNITSSISNLLNWLYTAFYTSIAWIIASIYLSFSKNNNEDKWTEDLLLDIKNEIIKSNEEVKYSNNLIIENLDKLNKWIWWDWDNSLVNQIKNFRTDSNDNFKELRKSFDEFAKKIAENNMKWLIEAIKQVMEDFNTKINDQLWQSFKELTNAIDNLLKWQEEYKDNIIISTDALNLSKDSLEKSSKWFEITVEKAEKFSWISESLWNELKYLNDSLEILKSWLKEFDWIANNNKESSIKLIESIESLKNNFVSKAEIMVSESELHIKNMKQSFESQSIDLKNSHKNILDWLKQELENNNKISSEQFLKMQWKLEEQVIEFDRKLWEELEKSLKTLWEQLTWLSGKFVSDYWNLAEKLEKLISISK